MNTINDNTLRLVLMLAADQAGISADAVQPGDRLVADLGFDSLDSIEMIMACEEEFDVMLPDPDAEGCTTVADCAALVDKTLAELRAG